jgi:phosphoribosylformylglycinamidine cyclo-ligase
MILRPPRHRRRAVTSAEQPRALSYRDAGVDIDAGEAVVERIKPLVRARSAPR